MGAANRRDRLRRSSHLNPRGTLAAEGVQQKFARRTAKPRDEPLELSVLRQPNSASFGEPLKTAWKDEAGAGDEIALTQLEVRREVFGSPAV
ncbi:MAG: hypothetical protein JWQ31_2581 [Mycobacterium sp.]|nr:hypothetical protein [Mycobacterium sp.]